VYWYLILAILAISFVSNEAYAQNTVTIIGDESLEPCFMNMTAGAELWSNCGANEDYLSFALAPFEYITGGYFSMIIVIIFIIMSYIKYHTVLYPMLIGLLFLPISYTFFPDTFLVYAVTLVAVGITGLIATMIIWRTRN
tara:strand:+ start:191 stop:610 length:420 start_codon:yes stop_codon:yes gene_type:complete